jgi:hypothetical protein
MRTTLEVADAIREVTAKMQAELDGGRSAKIDANDLIDLLLAIADSIDARTPVAANAAEGT